MSEQIQETITQVAHVANALPQFAEQGFLVSRCAIIDLASPDFLVDQRTYKEIATAFGKTIPAVPRHA